MTAIVLGLERRPEIVARESWSSSRYMVLSDSRSAISSFTSVNLRCLARLP